MNKIIVKIELHSDDETPPKLLHSFSITNDIGEHDSKYRIRKTAKHKTFNYLVNYKDKHFKVKDFPSWLNYLHLVKSAFNQLLPSINNKGKHGYLNPPEGWELSTRTYEVICPHGIGHYTGIDLPHGCDGCCSKIEGLLPQAQDTES